MCKRHPAGPYEKVKAHSATYSPPGCHAAGNLIKVEENKFVKVQPKFKRIKCKKKKKIVCIIVVWHGKAWHSTLKVVKQMVSHWLICVMDRSYLTDVAGFHQIYVGHRFTYRHLAEQAITPCHGSDTRHTTSV